MVDPLQQLALDQSQGVELPFLEVIMMCFIMETKGPLSRQRAIVAFSSAKECFLLARKDAQDKQSSAEYCSILFNILTISLVLCCCSFPEPVGTNLMFKLQHKD